MSYGLSVTGIEPEEFGKRVEEAQIANSYVDDVNERIDKSVDIVESMLEELDVQGKKINVSLNGHVKQGDTDGDSWNISLSVNP